MRRTLLVALSLVAFACGSGAVVGSSAGTGGGGTGGKGSTSSSTSTGTSSGTTTTNTSGCSGRVPQVHRPPGTTCPTQRGAGMTFPPGSLGCIVGQGCSSDADCTAGMNGRCGTRGFGAPCTLCTYDTCEDDSACDGGVPCDCRPSASSTLSNNCAPPGNCRVDTDCGPCGYCSPSTTAGSICSEDEHTYYCHTAMDACTDDADCPGQDCNFDTTMGHWVCEGECNQPP